MDSLTHRGWDKMAAIIDDISNAYSWKKLLYFDQNFIEICTQRSNEKCSSIGSEYGLVSLKAIMWNNLGWI